MANQGLNDSTDLTFCGHVHIKDINTKEVLADCYNQIHNENMSIAIAMSLCQQQGGFIQMMAFGNGGSMVSGTGAITYFPPNITNANAELYHETYRKVVNNQSPLDTDGTLNFMQVNHIANTTYSDIIITCTLDYSEPSQQDAFDNAPDTSGVYIFDELGLISYYIPPPTGQSAVGLGKLLTHVIFNPIQKSLNRQIEIVYTIRISLT
jgi:hypothetical protein